MKKNKVLKIVLIVLGTLVVLLLAAALAVVLYLRSMAAGIPETLPDAPADSTQVTLTDDELDKLLSGEISLDELTGETAASSEGEQEAAASAPQEEADVSVSSADTAASPASSASRTESSTASSSGKKENTPAASSSGTSSTAEKPASSASKQEAAYEKEVKALLKRLYSVKARAEAELNSCIAGAKAEFKALPESQQTQARKISIVLARSGRLYAMQAAYDREVESIVSQMRAVLTANGQSTALADQAMASYKTQKSAMYAQLTAKLYSRPTKRPMTTRSTSPGHRLCRKGAAGGFVLPVLPQYGEKILTVWMNVPGQRHGLLHTQGGQIVRTDGTVTRKAGKVALLPTNIQKICIKYKIALMLCCNEVNLFHVN